MLTEACEGRLQPLEPRVLVQGHWGELGTRVGRDCCAGRQRRYRRVDCSSYGWHKRIAASRRKRVKLGFLRHVCHAGWALSVGCERPKVGRVTPRVCLIRKASFVFARVPLPGLPSRNHPCPLHTASQPSAPRGGDNYTRTRSDGGRVTRSVSSLTASDSTAPISWSGHSTVRNSASKSVGLIGFTGS